MKTTTRKPRTIDEYLSGLSPDKRAALETLRRCIKSMVPDAQECISYSVPAFRFQGRMLVGFAAAANHCSFYPWSGSTVVEHRDLLRAYDCSKGAIRFPPDNPLPTALVRKLVKSRMTETQVRR